MQPKALFLFGTNKEDSRPNFGLFTWITNCWNGEYSIMACIGEPKLTKDRIREQSVFSANLVSAPLLPLADYLGNNSGYSPSKMDISLKVGRGAVLDVPILIDSPFIMELEVTKTVPLFEDSDIFICKIRNTIKSECSAGGNENVEEWLRLASPVISVGHQYFAVNPISIGSWGQWKNLNGEKPLTKI